MEHLQEDPEPPIDSKLSAMLESIPIDWFDPEAWNSFTVSERIGYTAGGITVGLPLGQYCDTLTKCVEEVEEVVGAGNVGEGVGGTSRQVLMEM